MKTYSVVVDQSKGHDLPDKFVVKLRQMCLSDPPMNVYSIVSCVPEIARTGLVFSPRILNNLVDNRRGVGGYLLEIIPDSDPENLSSYVSIAKVWVTPDYDFNNSGLR